MECLCQFQLFLNAIVGRRLSFIKKTSMPQLNQKNMPACNMLKRARYLEIQTSTVEDQIT